MWADWGNGVYSYYAELFTNVTGCPTNPAHDPLVMPVNLNGPNNLAPSPICDDNCVTTNTSPFRIRTTDNRNNFQEGTKSNGFMTVIKDDDQLKNDVVQAGFEVKEVGNKNDFVKFTVNGNEIYAQLLRLKVKKTSSGPSDWHHTSIGQEVQRSDVPDPPGARPITVSVVDDHVAHFTRGRWQYQIVTNTQLR